MEYGKSQLMDELKAAIHTYQNDHTAIEDISNVRLPQTKE
jgi:flagellar basal body-associated protein FliL